MFDRPPLIKLAEAAWYPLLSPPGRAKWKMLMEPDGFNAACSIGGRFRIRWLTPQPEIYLEMVCQGTSSI